MSDSIFNDADYLAENPDAVAVVKEGEFHSGHAPGLRC